MTHIRISSSSAVGERERPEAATITRRAALLRVVTLPLAAVISAELVACSKQPQCTDVSGLSPDDARLRTEIAAYVEQSPDPAKRCSGCMHFTSAGDKACGSCKVVKGPINPGGTCKLFAAKQG